MGFPTLPNIKENRMKKHILLVTFDSLRADYLGCYGRSAIRTPNLDAFALGGSISTITGLNEAMAPCGTSISGFRC